MTTKIMPVSDLRRKVSQTIKELQQEDEAVYIIRHILDYTLTRTEDTYHLPVVSTPDIDSEEAK